MIHCQITGSEWVQSDLKDKIERLQDFIHGRRISFDQKRSN